MDVAEMLAVREFLKVHEEEGPAAAIAWAARQEAEMAQASSADHLTLVEPESSDRPPSPRTAD